jgi:hypothetical protein
LQAVGDQHSFSQLVVTSDINMEFSNYNKILGIAADGGTITVQAGAKLWEINEALQARGLTLPIMGTQCTQTIAGAISTSTHGTGSQESSLSNSVIGMRLVLSDGGVVEVSDSVNPLIFQATRVGWGAIGIISTVTLAVVQNFKLERIVTGAMLFEDAVTFLAQLKAVPAYERFSWTFFPYPESPQDTFFIVYAPVPADTAINSCWGANKGRNPPIDRGTGINWPAGTTACIDNAYQVPYCLCYKTHARTMNTTQRLRFLSFANVCLIAGHGAARRNGGRVPFLVRICHGDDRQRQRRCGSREGAA